MNTTSPERKAYTEELSGLIERVSFHNDGSGFCVLRVKINLRLLLPGFMP